MNPIHTLINDTLALDEKATAGPMEAAYDQLHEAYTVRANGVFVCSTKTAEPIGGSAEIGRADAEMFAAFRSSAPTLARIAKIAVEAIEHGPHEHACIERNPRQPWKCTCEWKARALTAIEREAGK